MPSGIPSGRMEAADVNRAHWDALARVHGQDGYYDSEALVADRWSLGDVESAAVGDVAGLDLLHIQCHLGFDSIALARRGARVTGVDFSGGALARAAPLAPRRGGAAGRGGGGPAGPPAPPRGGLGNV